MRDGGGGARGRAVPGQVQPVGYHREREAADAAIGEEEGKVGGADLKGEGRKSILYISAEVPAVVLVSTSNLDLDDR